MEDSCKCKKGSCIKCFKCPRCKCQCGKVSKARKRSDIQPTGTSQAAESSDPLDSTKWLCDMFDINKSTLSSLPGASIRRITAIKDLDQRSMTRMVTLVKTILEKVCKIISPIDAEGLMKELPLTMK